MTANYQQTISQILRNETQKAVEAFNALDTDAKLAWLYFVYEKMGESVTPAAPTAADPELAPILLGDYLQISSQQQLDIMRDIINRKDTEYSRAYGALKENNQLLVWYTWAVEMGDTVVDIPGDYKASEAINDALAQIEELDFQGQISVLRAIAGEFGYTDVKPIATQGETGKTSSL
jgi:hypothetical protein